MLAHPLFVANATLVRFDNYLFSGLLGLVVRARPESRNKSDYKGLWDPVGLLLAEATSYRGYILSMLFIFTV